MQRASEAIQKRTKKVDEYKGPSYYQSMLKVCQKYPDALNHQDLLRKYQ